MHFSSILAVLGCCLLTSSLFAHNGRRFEVTIDGGRYVAQGSNTGADDGAPSIRPYDNALHDHWRNVLTNVSTAILPGFDVTGDSRIVGLDLELTLLDVYKWESPPMMPNDETVPQFVPLSEGEDFNISFEGQRIDNTRLADGTFGSLTLVEQTPIAGASDLDPLYTISPTPVDVIHVFEFQISDQHNFTPASEPIFAVLSPDGANMAERLHHASLFVEEYLAERQDAVRIGDFDFDGDVDIRDFLRLSRNFGKFVDERQDGDANNDGLVNLDDFLVLSRNFERPISAGTGEPVSVPEPATGTPFLVLMLLVISCRRAGRRDR